jgi:beta-lactamase class A
MLNSKTNRNRADQIQNMTYRSYSYSQFNGPPGPPYHHQHSRRFHQKLVRTGKLAFGLAFFAGLIFIGPRLLDQSSKAKATASRYSDYQLSQRISSIAQSNPQVTVGASLIDLSTGKQLNFDNTQPVVAASTTKLITATAYLHQVELGNYSLSDTLDDGTAGWQLKELVNQSDDDSWQDFKTLLGSGQIQDYAHQIGLSSFEISPNTITPADEANLVYQLYQGKLLNAAHTKLLLSYMLNTNDQTLIPAALPSSYTVYNKYGELLETGGNYVNDAAVVISPTRTYILTIYTNRSDELDITTRDNIIHQITQAVNEYENGL